MGAGGCIQAPQIGPCDEINCRTIRAKQAARILAGGDVPIR